MKTNSKPVNLSIHYIHCLELEEKLENWCPEDPRRVCLMLEICAGWTDWDTTRNIFTLHVVTNDLRKRPEKFHAPTIYVDEFHWPIVKDEIFHRVAACERNTWDESFHELQKRFDLFY